MTILEQRAAESICDIAKSLRGIDISLKQMVTLFKPIYNNNDECKDAEEQEKLVRLSKRPNKETQIKLGEYFEKLLNTTPEERLAICNKLDEDVNKIVQGIGKSLNRS
ncbi:MAG: hypothetical protein KBT34_10510 [Prevotella sp.]|nr:hypothetical protein [Candidatus Prevotella equi]